MPLANPRARALSHLGRTTTGCYRMFRCHFCAVCTPARTKAVRVSIAARTRHYPRRPDANPAAHDGKRGFSDDPGGAGYEIVREVLACPACAARERRPLTELTASPVDERSADEAR